MNPQQGGQQPKQSLSVGKSQRKGLYKGFLNNIQ